MPDQRDRTERPSADRTAELLLWCHREPSRYGAEGRRSNAPPTNGEVIVKLALGRRVEFADAALNDPRMSVALKRAAEAYIRNVYFHPEANPYQTLGLNPGASQDEIKESFRQLMHLVHPDRQGDRKLWPDGFAAQANRAYAQLRDPDARDRLEREAEARAALARAISRAASAAEASQMPVVTWPKGNRRGRATMPSTALPEWLTAGVGGYARRNPAVAVFAGLGVCAVLFVGATARNGQDGMLIRVAQEPSRVAEMLVAPTRPLPGPSVGAGGDAREVATQRRGSAAPQSPLVVASSEGGEHAAAASARNVSLPSQSARSATPAAETLAPGDSPSAPDSRSTTTTGISSSTAPATVAASAPARTQMEAAPVPDPPRTSIAVGASASEVDTSTGRSTALAGRADNAAVSSVSVVAAPASASAPPASAEIEALFASFVEAYERGRADAFAALFDEDAETNLRRGRAAIRGEYDELFRLSQWRRMQLTRVNWRRAGDRAIAKGEITVKIGWKDGREVEQRLDLHMELMRRDDRVVIARLTHQPRGP